MNKNKYVFAQLVEFLDCFKFRCIVAKYNGDVLQMAKAVPQD